MKGCSTLLTIKEKQTKTTVRASGWSRRMCTHLLLQEQQNHNQLLNYWTWRMLEPIKKKDTPMSKDTEEASQQDGKRGTIMIKSSPIPSRWVTQQTENQEDQGQTHAVTLIIFLTFYFAFQSSMINSISFGVNSRRSSRSHKTDQLQLWDCGNIIDLDYYDVEWFGPGNK